MSEVVEIVNSHWDAFTAPLMDKSTTEYEYAEYREKNVNVAGLTQYELINQDLDLFLLPSESYIQVKCTISNTVGDIISGGDIALENSGFSIFDKGFYYMNDQAIENLDYVGMLTHVKHICNASKESEHSLQQQGFCLDRGYGGVANNLTFVNVTAAPRTPTSITTTNAGLFLFANTLVTDNDTIQMFINGNRIMMDIHRTAAGTHAVNQAITALQAGGIKYTPGLVTDLFRFYDSVTQKEVKFYANGHLLEPASPADNTAIAFLPVDGTVLVGGEIVTVSYADEIPANYFRGIPFSNQGFLKRRNVQFYSADPAAGYSKQFTLMLPLWKLFPIFEANRHVFRGVKHTIRLYKNQQLNDIIMRSLNTPAIGSVNINYISWWVPTLKPTIKVGLELDQQLGGGAHKVLAWNGCQIFKSNVYDPATTNGSYRITSTAHKPTRIVAFFQLASKYTSQIENSRLFDSLLNGPNSGVARAHIRVGSQQYPKDEYQSTFTTKALSANEDLGRLYSMYLSVCGFEKDSDKGAPLSYEEFRDLYPMWVFDLSAQDEQIWVNITSLDIEFRWQLNAAAAGQFIVWTFVEYQREITLSGINSRMAIKL